jgi:hypothetical protein
VEHAGQQMAKRDTNDDAEKNPEGEITFKSRHQAEFPDLLCGPQQTRVIR